MVESRRLTQSSGYPSTTLTCVSFISDLMLCVNSLTMNLCNYSCHFSSLSGLLLILQVPMSIMPLLQTKKSESVPALFVRYLETAGYTKKWYEHDLLDKDSEGWK